MGRCASRLRPGRSVWRERFRYPPRLLKRRRASWETWGKHTYLRISPELRAGVYGPQTGAEPAVTTDRHAVLDGFGETDILPFAGRLEVVRVTGVAKMPLTYVPPFPIYPPEPAWMRYPTSDVPALVLNQQRSGRVANLAADIDRCFGRDNLPDHADLLANLVRWAAHGRIPLRVEGPGLFDCHLYRQQCRLILHLVNLTSAGTWRAPIHELIPVGPLTVRLQFPDGKGGVTARSLVSSSNVDVRIEAGWAVVTVPSVTDHEVIVVS